MKFISRIETGSLKSFFFDTIEIVHSFPVSECGLYKFIHIRYELSTTNFNHDDTITIYLSTSNSTYRFIDNDNALLLIGCNTDNIHQFNSKLFYSSLKQLFMNTAYNMEKAGNNKILYYENSEAHEIKSTTANEYIKMFNKYLLIPEIKSYFELDLKTIINTTFFKKEGL